MAISIVLLCALFVLAQGSHMSHVGHESFSVGREYLPVEHGSIPVGHGDHHYGIAAQHGHHLSVPQHHGHVPAQHVFGSVAPDSYHQVAAPVFHHHRHHHHGASSPIVHHVHRNRNCHATIRCPHSVSRTYASDGHYCYRFNSPCDLAIANCQRRNELKSILRPISHGECHHLPRGQRPY